MTDDEWAFLQPYRDALKIACDNLSGSLLPGLTTYSMSERYRADCDLAQRAYERALDRVNAGRMFPSDRIIDI